jgi:hypothetical protein
MFANGASATAALHGTPERQLDSQYVYVSRRLENYLEREEFFTPAPAVVETPAAMASKGVNAPVKATTTSPAKGHAHDSDPNSDEPTIRHTLRTFEAFTGAEDFATTMRPATAPSANGIVSLTSGSPVSSTAARRTKY